MDAAASPARDKSPRYLQLAAELREAIIAGRYHDGVQFPTETALCERYRVSRFTVREALRRLEGEGLISRRRGSGTVVQPASARAGALHQPLSNVGELLQYAAGSEVTYVERGAGELPPRLAEQLDRNCAGRWHRFHGVRRQAGDPRPIAATDVFLHERLGTAIDRLDLGAGTLFTQLERLAGLAIGRVTQDIQAVPATREMASALEIDEGAPVLRILRCYCDRGGQLFELSVSHHPGERFAYSMHIDLDD